MSDLVLPPGANAAQAPHVRQVWVTGLPFPVWAMSNKINRQISVVQTPIGATMIESCEISECWVSERAKLVGLSINGHYTTYPCTPSWWESRDGAEKS